MSNALLAFMKRTISTRFADRLSIEETKKYADRLIESHKQRDLDIYVEGDYIRIVQCVCPLGNPEPISAVVHLRRDQMTQEQLDYFLQHLS